MVQHNPKRPGTASHARFALYMSAKTKGEFLALGGTAADFVHDLGRGFVTVIDDEVTSP